MAQAPLSLKARAIGLLAQREHSRNELRRKLLRIEAQQRHVRFAAAQVTDGHDNPPRSPAGGAFCAEEDLEAGEAAVEVLLDALAADGYLDETRFVESRVHVRARRFGAQRIQQELLQHGLRLDAEQQATLRATELARAREVWLKRFGPEPATKPAEQARQTRFLLARGFAADAVRRVLRSPG